MLGVLTCPFSLLKNHLDSIVKNKENTSKIPSGFGPEIKILNKYSSVFLYVVKQNVIQVTPPVECECPFMFPACKKQVKISQAKNNGHPKEP